MHTAVLPRLDEDIRLIMKSISMKHRIVCGVERRRRRHDTALSRAGLKAGPHLKPGLTWKEKGHGIILTEANETRGRSGRGQVRTLLSSRHHTTPCESVFLFLDG